MLCPASAHVFPDHSEHSLGAIILQGLFLKGSLQAAALFQQLGRFTSQRCARWPLCPKQPLACLLISSQLVVTDLTLLLAQIEGEEQKEFCLLQVSSSQTAAGSVDLDLPNYRGFSCSWAGWGCRTPWCYILPCPLDEG